MSSIRKDIQDREDIIRLVDLFYDKVRADEMLFPVFSHVDWPAHLPTMYSFWASLLLGEQSYTGNPFQKHRGLAITGAHFDQWLSLFRSAVMENFEGERASEAVERATNIASLFRHRMGLGLGD